MTKDSFTLDVSDLHWISELDPRYDLCAHGRVEFAINGSRVEHEFDDALCVSAAGMNLLRSLELEHSAEAPISENLFPHCGHEWMRSEDGDLINISECPYGLDLEVRHSGESIRLQVADGRSATVSAADWSQGVYGFVDKVEDFYCQSEPKDLSFDELGWFRTFWEEWRARRARTQ